MIRKFAKVPRFRVALGLVLTAMLTGAMSVHAQQPAAQPAAPQSPAQPPAAQPDSQQASTQEATLEDMPGRKPKVKQYKNWVFYAGAGASLTNGNTANFVRGGGGIVSAGVARNYSEYLGLRADFQFDNLPLRNSALAQAQAPGANAHVYSFLFEPIINIPVSKNWGGFIVGGPAYFHRSGKLDSSTAIAGNPCDGFFAWWGTCNAGGLPTNGKFLSSSQDEFGESFGFGITRKIRPNMEFYAEFRYLHGRANGITTDLRPITAGVRW